MFYIINNIFQYFFYTPKVDMNCSFKNILIISISLSLSKKLLFQKM